MAQLTFKPLHATFGAECQNVEFSKPLPESIIAEIRNGMAKYGVLVFRNTAMNDIRHEQFARQFGEPDLSAVDFSRGTGRRRQQRPHNELVDVSNIGEDGKVESADSMRARTYRGNSLFHVDCSYNARRAGFSILRAVTLPPTGTGGATEFADTRTAYDDLDVEMKQKIKDYVLCHSILQSRRLGDSAAAVFRWMRIHDFPHHYHKLVQLHESSGRMNLYIAAHAHHIEGLTEEQSRPIIEQLLLHASKGEYTFAINWENEGDVVIWDNTCVMHRAAGGSFQGKFVRDMKRATVYDAASSARGELVPAKGGIKWTFLLYLLVKYISQFMQSVFSH